MEYRGKLEPAINQKRTSSGSFGDRPILEETGIREIQDPQIITSVVANIRIPLDGDDVGLILMIYSCRVLESVAIQMSDEHLQAGWFEAPEAARLLTVKYPPEFTQAIENIDV